jgi:hypothetical protein
MEYNKFSVKELKTILDKKGVKGYSKYRKDELVNILAKLENIEDEENNELDIPLPPKIEFKNIKPDQDKNKENQEIVNENKQDQEIVNENKQDQEIVNEDKNKENQEIEIEDNETEENQEIEIEDNEESHLSEEVPKNENVEERIKDPVKLFENFKPTLAISGNKKSEILKGMIEYKTAQKLMERQEIQREIDKVANDLKIIRQEYLAITDLIKKDLKEVRESFLMSSLIILHNFSFLPLDKLPIFKSHQLKKN